MNKNLFVCCSEQYISIRFAIELRENSLRTALYGKCVFTGYKLTWDSFLPRLSSWILFSIFNIIIEQRTFLYFAINTIDATRRNRNYFSFFLLVMFARLRSKTPCYRSQQEEANTKCDPKNVFSAFLVISNRYWVWFEFMISCFFIFLVNNLY